MSNRKLLVQATGCPTCPYLKSTPPGIWSAEEYHKLADFDEPEHGGPKIPEALSTFLCHQGNASGIDTVCRGWLSVHRHEIGVRVAVMTGQLDIDDVPTEDEPEYYATGTEARDAGLAAIETPSDEALLACRKLERKGAGQWEDRKWKDE